MVAAAEVEAEAEVGGGEVVAEAVAVAVAVAPALTAASASTRPQPKWLFGTWSTPPHCPPLLEVTFGFAVGESTCFVAAMFLHRYGRADQSSATTPTMWGEAIEVPR